MTGALVVWENDLSRLGPEGSALPGRLASVPGSTIFNTREWMTCAAAAVPPGRTLHVLYVLKEGELAACVPLTRGIEAIHGVPSTTLRLLGDPLSDRVVIQACPSEEGLDSLLLDALFRFPLEWDVILLSELPEDGVFREAVDRWGAVRGVGLHWRHCARSPVLELGFADTDRLRRSYPKSLATRLRRSRKKLNGAGKVEFLRLTPAPGEVDRLLKGFKEIEDASWKGREGVGIFSTECRFRFFRDLSVAFAERGWLDVGMLSLDGRLISYRYGFRYKNVFLDYNLAFHPDFAEMGPGRILLDEMIASSLEIGLDAVDASRGDIRTGHQLKDWTDRYIDHFELWIFNTSPRGRYLNLMRNRIRPRWIRLKKSNGPEGQP